MDCRRLTKCDCLKVSKLMVCTWMYRKPYPTTILFNEQYSFCSDQMPAFGSKADIDEPPRAYSIF
jgi:hypothetical protein